MISPAWQDNGHGFYVVPRRSVLDGPHPAGVGRYVAAQGGKLLTWIGRIEKAPGFSILGKVCQKNPCFDADIHVFLVVTKDLVHAHGAQNDAPLDRGASPYEARSRAADRDGDMMAGTDFHDG